MSNDKRSSTPNCSRRASRRRTRSLGGSPQWPAVNCPQAAGFEGFAVGAARHPSRVRDSVGLPSRSSRSRAKDGPSSPLPR